MKEGGRGREVEGEVRAACSNRVLVRDPQYKQEKTCCPT